MRRRLHDWILAVFDAQLPEFRKVAERLATHLDAVIAGHQHNVPLGLAESINSKIAVLRFQARGYRDPEYFKLKISSALLAARQSVGEDRAMSSRISERSLKFR